MTSVSTKKSAKELHNNDETEEDINVERGYISPEERQQIIEKLRLVPKKYV